jgi:DNA primase
MAKPNPSPGAGMKDIVEIIGKYLRLQNNSAQCPFHATLDYTFRVDPESQTFVCSKCGIQGNLVDFVAAYEDVDEATATKMIEEQPMAE